MDNVDVVVVGARCAGAPLATMLARRGLNVCLVDRATFPSELPSTHVLQPCGALILHQLGVL
ncbi:MAG TPA: FAD-dependent monooxygenase, partial [Jatrophihabitantaceae bacterium]|nr:FAD-dependent monooxygenase [Jatrophihabitantaceae bacterium]